MTFKDTNVIIGNDLNEEEDLLENVDLQSQFRQRRKNNAKLNIKQRSGGYTENGEFKKQILPHYDEFDEEEEERKQ